MCARPASRKWSGRCLNAAPPQHVLVSLAPRAMPFLRDHPESVLGSAFAWDEHDAFGVESFEAAVREAAST